MSENNMVKKLQLEAQEKKINFSIEKFKILNLVESIMKLSTCKSATIRSAYADVTKNLLQNKKYELNQLYKYIEVPGIDNLKKREDYVHNISYGLSKLTVTKKLILELNELCENLTYVLSFIK